MGQPRVLPSIRVLIATSSISSSDNRKGEEAMGKKQSKEEDISVKCHWLVPFHFHHHFHFHFIAL
jgi:hypothetical protein